jgi:hypothetical protein
VRTDERPAAPASGRRHAAGIAGAGEAALEADPPEPGTAPARRGTSLRLGCGLLLAWVAVALRWLSPVLHGGVRAGAIPLAVSGPLAWLHASFELPLAALAAVSLLAAAHSGGRPSALTRACGIGLLAVACYFVIEVRIADLATVRLLQSDNWQYQTISQEFGYQSAVYSPPTSFLGFAFDPVTTLLLNSLGAGWYAALAAGALLTRRPLVRRSAGRRPALLVTAGALALSASVPLALALVAQRERVAGISAIGSGAPALAEQRLRLASRLDPTIADDPGFELALGQTEDALGQSHSALALYAQAVSPSGDEITTLRKMQLLGQALRLDPSNSVVALTLGDLAVSATEYAGVPVDLPGDSGDLALPEVAYTFGHTAYKAGDSQAAERYLRILLDDADNTEVRSFALTYLALSEQRLGDEVGFRRDIIAALRADPLQENPFAEEISAGLYEPGTP